jgi:hypothetical protein
VWVLLQQPFAPGNADTEFVQVIDPLVGIEDIASPMLLAWN